MNFKRIDEWMNSLSEKVNFAALRLMFGKQSASEVRAALEWERKHR